MRDVEVSGFRATKRQARERLLFAFSHEPSRRVFERRGLAATPRLPLYSATVA